MNSVKAKKIAEETINAIERFAYKNNKGKTIPLKQSVISAIKKSKLYKPNCNIEFESQVNYHPIISVTNESTLQAAARLAKSNPCILNFASAKHPGGGFLRGSIAQEESIARSSALYHTLITHKEMYENNKKANNFYLDYAIYSPNIPVIKDDEGNWLDEPYLTSVVTSPAPNKDSILTSTSGVNLDSQALNNIELKIAEVLFQRMDQFLNIMAQNDHRTIVLGAWGCGIFGNNPKVVAMLFKQAIKQTPFFDEIIFAIYDSPGSIVYKTFETVFK